MRRYAILAILAIVLLIAALKSQPSAPALALAPGAVDAAAGTPTIGIQLPLVLVQPTVTPTPTDTATPTATDTQTQSPTNTPTQSATPVSISYFPFVVRQPTLTPTPTYTSLPTLTPSITPVNPNCSGRFDGSITLEDNKPTYATHIEWVKFLQWVHNNNNNTTCFGILGFDAIKPSGSHMQYNTQWGAAGVSDKYLRINANCWGPNGQPCAGSQASGQQEDHVGTVPGAHTPWEVTDPGVYNVYYTVCYSNYDACQQPGSNWAVLGSIQFTAIDWTPSAPSSGTAVAPTPAPFSGPVCYLVTDDPRGWYLNCNASQLKQRRLFRN